MTQPAQTKALTEPSSERLLRELLLLRKGRGFSPERLKDIPHLIGFLGGIQEPYDHLRERFVSAINSLRDPEPELLLAVYGLDDDTKHLPGLKERRVHYGKTIQRGHETVADMESPALEHLRAQLVSGWYPLSPMDFRLPMSHNGIVFESFQNETIVVNRHWFQTRYRFTFLAAFDEADYVQIVRDVPGEVVQINPEFTAEAIPLETGCKLQFTHHGSPMRRGCLYNVDAVVRATDELPTMECLTEESIAFHEPARRVGFSVRFVGEQPQIAWQFSGLTMLERPGVPTASSLLSGQVIAAQMNDLYGGLNCGLAWQWPGDSPT